MEIQTGVLHLGCFSFCFFFPAAFYCIGGIRGNKINFSLSL